MSLSTLTSKGQLTLPKDIRQYLHISSGDKVEFIIEEDGKVRLITKIRDITQLRGIVKSPHSKPVSIETMNASIKQAAKHRFSRK